MAIGSGFAEDVFEAGGGAHDRVARDADFLRNFVGGFETDAGNVTREEIWILADAFDGAFAVGFVNANGTSGADSMRMEKNHDLANDFLFGPGVLDALAAARTDSFHFLKATGEVFDDGENLFAEFLDEFLGVFGTDPFDHSAAEVTLDAFAGGRRDGTEFFGAEFETVIFVVHPVSLSGEPFAGSDAGE